MNNQPQNLIELLDYIKQEMKELNIEIREKQALYTKLYLYTIYLEDIAKKEEKNGNI